MVFRAILTKVFGSKNDRELKRIWPVVGRINELEPQMKRLSDADLQRQTILFRERLGRGEPLSDLLPEAFAVVREASSRVLNMRHFDVQLLGGMVLHEGKIAEMKTGEGKTLVATLPVYLNALEGKGVHVVTVNDYLARRDAEWMGTIYRFLGLSTGVIVSGFDFSARQQQYACDVTYGQNNEFGFDYLRDNMKLELAEKVQRPHNYAIVDEVDSILIDEARTPLIISGPSDEVTDKYYIADQTVRRLEAEKHFTVDLKSKQVMLTDDGVKFIEDLLKLENLYDPRNIQFVHHINQALKAHVTMTRDIDYVVRNGEVIIVDEFTGRLMAGRRWSDGLHQAIEAKEGVTVNRENQTLATITFQNYFRMYKKLAGMTGTADTEAVEFKKIYNLDVNVMPTNQPMVRTDHPDVVFLAEEAKFKAVCDEIQTAYDKGQPVLVGTASIAKSEMLSELLKKRGISHHVLNAKHHEREAEIIAQAGRYKAVTISTNMAGRGTDIVLGGNPEFLATAEAGTKDHADPGFQESYARWREVCAEERRKVVEAGGLHILGTERHESRRIDNQLRGRSGRQGDPGSSRFYISLEDDLMKRFGGERMKAIMQGRMLKLQDDDAIEGPLVARAIENAQKKVEGYHFDIRKHLLEYDDVMNKQRGVVYDLRDKILASEGIEDEVVDMVGDVIEDIIMSRANEKEAPEKWDIPGMFAEFQRVFGMEFSAAPYLERMGSVGQGIAQEIFDEVKTKALHRYDERKQHFGPERMVKLARVVMLQTIDFFWKEHLVNMDHLKEGIGLRGYGQKNPLYEYQREALSLFGSMMLTVKGAVVEPLFQMELPSEEEILRMEAQEREAQHRREAAASTIHEDVTGQGSEGPREGAAAGGESGNRAQRRRQQTATGAAAAESAESAGAAAPGSALERAKREAARKKNKLAKQARKKSR